MKKLFSLLACLAVAGVGMAQVIPSDYDNDALNRALNDSVNKFYTVTSHQLKSVAGVEVIDSSLLNLQRYQWPKNGLYKPSFNANNELQIVFDRAKGDTLNYSEFNFLWAGWGKNTMAVLPRKGLSPFPYKVSGTSVNPAISEVDKQDTLFGYAVNFRNNPEVRLTVRCSQPTNIRVDLIDKNQRWANVLAPHHRVTTINKDTTLIFRWDYRPLDANNVPDWTFEILGMNDFNIGVAADGFSTDWWGVDNGRSVQNGVAPLPILAGRQFWSGALVLDYSNIIGMAVTLEDGNITLADGKDFAYGMTDKKTLYIKNMYIGSSTDFVDLTGKLTKMPKLVRDTVSRLVSVSPEKLTQGTKKTFTIVGVGKPFAAGIYLVSLIDPKTKQKLSVSNFVTTNDSILSVDVSAINNASIGYYDLTITDLNKNVFSYKSAIQVEAIPLSDAQFVAITPNVLKQNQYKTIDLVVKNANFIGNRPSSVLFTNHDDASQKQETPYFDAYDDRLSFIMFFPRASAAGKYDVSLVYNVNGQSVTIPLAENVLDISPIPPLQLDSLVPAQATKGMDYAASLLLSDTAFTYPQFQFINPATGSIIDVLGNGKTYEGAFGINKFIGNVAAGYYDLSVTEYTTDGTNKQLVLKKALYIAEPEIVPITSFSPDNGMQGEMVRCTLVVKDHNFGEGEITATASLNNDLPINFTLISRSNDTLVMDLPVGDSKAGVYDVSLKHFASNFYYNFSAQSALSIKAAAPLEFKSLSIKSAQLWRDTMAVLNVKNAHFLSADYVWIDFRNENYFIPFQSTIINDSCIELRISPNKIMGAYDLFVTVGKNGLKRELRAPAILQVTKGQPTQIFLDSQVVINQGKGKYVSVVVPNANFDIYYSFQIDSCSMILPSATMLNDSTLSIYVYANDTAVGTYDFSFLFIQNGVRRKLFAKNAVKVEKMITPVFKHLTQTSILINSWTNIGVVYTNGLFWATYPSEIEIIKDSKPIDTVSTWIWNDDSLSFSVPGNLAEGTYDLRLLTIKNKLIKDFYIPSAFRVYDPSNPHIVSVSPSTKPQYVSTQLRVKVANANFSQYVPSQLYFKGKTSSFSSSVISVIDSETLLVTLISSTAVVPDVYSVSMTIYNGTAYKTSEIANALTITPSKAEPFIQNIYPTSVKQDTTISLVITGKNCSFVDANIYSLRLVHGNFAAVIVPSSITKINDTMLRCSLVIPESVAVGSYQLTLSERGTESEKFTYPIIDAAFTVLPNPASPNIIKLVSGTAQQGETCTVYLSAQNVDFILNKPTNIVFKQSPNTINITQLQSALYPSDITVIDQHHLQFNLKVPRLANVGYYDVRMTYNNQTLYLDKGFVLTANPDAPRLVSISQTEVKQGNKLVATLTGLNVNFQPSSWYEAGFATSRVGFRIDTITVISDNSISISCKIPESAPEGMYDLLLNVETSNSATDTYNTEFFTLPNAITVLKSNKSGEETTNVINTTEQIIEAYPNPTAGQLLVLSPTTAKLEIVNVMGQVLVPLQDLAIGKNYLDISSLSAGIYKLVIYCNEEIKVLNVQKM